MQTNKITGLLNSLFEFPQVFSREVIQTATEKIVRLEPIPEIIMFFILKASELYRDLSEFFISYALPNLLERKVWGFPIIWKGFITFIERKIPLSLTVVDMMHVD